MKKSRRLIKAVLAGALAGAFIVALIGLPGFIHAQNARRYAAIRQENLVPARGEAFGAVPMAEVSILALLDGKPTEGITVSPDGMNWYVPQDGLVTLPLVSGRYELRAAYKNRVTSLAYDVREGQDNRLALELGRTPRAPELTIVEVPEDSDRLIPLDIGGADSIRPERMPNGIGLVRADGGFALSVDSGLTDCGFYPFTLIAENGYGQTAAHIGVRIPRNKPLTPVYTAEDFKNIRRDLSGGYILMNDLDMSDIHDWTPLATPEYPFTGVLDGGGHEITGFHSPESIMEGNNFSLLGTVKNAEIRGVIVREPRISPEVPAREGNITFACCVLAGGVTNSLIENCASIGGVVSPSDNYSSGICGLEGSIAIGLFNSTDVVSEAPNRYLPNTGGLFLAVGGYSYAACCANEGDVFGRHLTGGITGYNNMSEISRCISSGYIRGSILVGEFPPGGIMQTTDFGAARDCYFVKGMSAVGGKAFNPSVLGLLAPIDEKDLRNRGALPLLGDFDGDNPDWAFASLDAKGPIPRGIFRLQAERPVMPESGNEVVLPAAEGVRYFYTLDGSDPYTGNPAETTGLTAVLSKGQVLTVYAARSGRRDSDIVVYRPEGGE